MVGKPGLSGHRTEVVGTRLTAAERQRLVTDRRGALTESAYVRWVLTRAADVDPHAGGVEVRNLDGRVSIIEEHIPDDLDDE